MATMLSVGAWRYSTGVWPGSDGLTFWLLAGMMLLDFTRPPEKVLSSSDQDAFPIEN